MIETLWFLMESLSQTAYREVVVWGVILVLSRFVIALR